MGVNYPVTSGFLAKEEFRTSEHLGMDFSMPKDTPLRSIQEGVIEKIVYQPSGLGRAVYVKWKNGKTAIYGHMNKVTVNKGEAVQPGDLLGYSGNTGNVVGANGGYHLHFGLKNEKGAFINPEEYAPLIQSMNNNNFREMMMTTTGSKSTTIELFQTALEKFSDALTEMNLNLNLNMIDWTIF